jgi:hypothetical protein
MRPIHDSIVHGFEDHGGSVIDACMLVLADHCITVNLLRAIVSESCHDTYLSCASYQGSVVVLLEVICCRAGASLST